MLEAGVVVADVMLKGAEQTWTSQVFPGTVRDYRVYVPAQHKPGAECRPQ